MPANAQWGPIYNLADWVEDQAGVDAATVYVGKSADPNASTPTTVTFRPYGADARPNKGSHVQRFQCIGRGPAAFEQMMQIYDYLAGLEAVVDDVILTVVPLQSVPILIGEEEDGTMWTQNYVMEWTLP